MHPIVIVGSGMAGYTLAREFRKRDPDTLLLMMTTDDGAAYAKPSLSNALAGGKTAAALVNANAAKMAADLDMQVLTHTRVTAFDTRLTRLRYRNTQTGDIADIAYDQLVLALGADPIAHGLAGNAADAVLTVNSLADYAVFRTAIAGGRSVVILGGGLIGCEFANDLATAGYAVTVVHAGDWPLQRLLPTEAGTRLADDLARLGVHWHFGRRALRVDHDAGKFSVVLDNGERVGCDVVLSAIGLRPRVQLAQSAGLACKRGIVVNRFLNASANRVYALGDCAEVEGANLPFVQPLLIQARALAATLAGETTAVVYPPMPVTVKTPAHPVVILPPKTASDGGWQVDCSAGGVCALHRETDGRLTGFALSGSETSRRSALAKEMAAA
jgi:rubredoxin-NAD+ reductase